MHLLIYLMLCKLSVRCIQARRTHIKTENNWLLTLTPCGSTYLTLIFFCLFLRKMVITCCCINSEILSAMAF